MTAKLLHSKSVTRLVIVGIIMFVVGWIAHRQAPQDHQKLLQQTETSQRTSHVMFGGSVVSDLLQWSKIIEQTDNDELSSMASRLLASSHAQSIGHWAPLLARWSVSDGRVMISFIEKQAPASIREKLLQNAWFAWGYTDPDEAFTSSLNLSNSLTQHLLTGIAESSPLKAADYVRMVPDSQFAVWPIAAAIFEADPNLAAEFEATAVYDGGRFPFERLRINHLATSDPAAAIAYARSLGILGRDQVPDAVKAIALIDPAQAAAQVHDMPSNRSRALSAVALASAWAAKDIESATKWARENLSGPVLHHSLVAAAVASDDPETALDLINEAGWDTGSDFFNVRDWGSTGASEALYRITAQDAARQLIDRVAQKNPDQARILLETKVPEHLRSTIVVGTQIAP